MDHHSDPDKVLKEIREYTQAIYHLGENSSGKFKVSAQHIKANFKGKPGDAASVILNSVKLLDEAVFTIEKLMKKNEELSKEKSASQIAEMTGKKILQYVSENINENASSLASSAQKLKSYADVLESKKSQVSTLLDNKAGKDTSATSVKTIKSAIRNELREHKSREDRSRNVIIFGLEEKEDDELVNRLGCIFNTIEEVSECDMLSVEHAERIGEKGEKVRPIRVAMSDKQMAYNATKNSKVLRGTEKYKNVYLSVDRTPEQQGAHKELITRLKQSMKNHPDKYWYIRNGNICSNQRQ